MHLITIQALNSKHHVNQPLKYDLVVWENSISKSNGASPEHSPDFIANNYYTSWRTYFSHWYPAAVVRGIDSNCQFPAFSSTFRFCKGEKKISVMKIPHVTRITSQTEHSWLWNSPPTPNGAYPYRKLESILKWKKDGAKCYLWAMTLGSRWTHREDTHSVPNRVIRKRKHHCSQRRPSLEVQLRAQHYSPKPRSPQQEQSYTSEGANNYNFNSGA